MNWKTLNLTRNSAYQRRWRQRLRSRGQDEEERWWRASEPSPDHPRWRQWPRRRRRTLRWRSARASFPCAIRIAWPCSWTLCLGETSARVSCFLARWANCWGRDVIGRCLPVKALTQAGLGANLITYCLVPGPRESFWFGPFGGQRWAILFILWVG